MSNGNEDKVDHKKGITIDWSRVVTTAISTLIAAVFVGAATVVWTAAVEQDKRIQQRVDAASTNLMRTQLQQEEAQKTLLDQIGALHSAIDGQRADITKLAALFTNRTETSSVAAIVSALTLTNASWDEYIFRGRTNAKNLNQQIQQQVQQRWDPQQQQQVQQK